MPFVSTPAQALPTAIFGHCTVPLRTIGYMRHVRWVAATVVLSAVLSPAGTVPAQTAQSGVAAPPLAPSESTRAATAGVLDRARAQLNSNHPGMAEALVRQDLVTDPQSAEAHFLLGFILFREIQAEGTETGDASGSRVQPAFAKLRDEKARESLAQYTLGAGLHVPSAFDLKIVALDYVLLGDYNDANKWLDKSLAWNPADDQSWYYLGRIKYKEADYHAAVDAFLHALTLSAHNIAAEDNLGLAYGELGQNDAAENAYKNALAWAEEAHARNNGPWLDLGSLLLKQQQTVEALPYLKRAAEMNANDVRPREKLAEAYKTLGRWTEVQTELEAAVQLAPDEASLHFLLGQAYQKNGQPEKARVQFDRTAALHAHGATAAGDPPNR